MAAVSEGTPIPVAAESPGCATGEARGRRERNAEITAIPAAAAAERGPDIGLRAAPGVGRPASSFSARLARSAVEGELFVESSATLAATAPPRQLLAAPMAAAQGLRDASGLVAPDAAAAVVALAPRRAGAGTPAHPAGDTRRFSAFLSLEGAPMWMPRAAAPPPPTAGAALRRITTVRGSHVLLVEDSPAALRVAVYVLKQLGCVVRTVDEAAGAVAAVMEAAAAGTPIDVVVMNFAREGAAPHGDAVLAAMRGAGQQMPLLLYTADAMRPGGERYHSVGFAGESGQRVWTDVTHLAVAQALATARPPARDAPARAATELELL